MTITEPSSFNVLSSSFLICESNDVLISMIAKEFLSDNGNYGSTNGWKSLPKRLERLCDRILDDEESIFNNNNDDENVNNGNIRKTNNKKKKITRTKPNRISCWFSSDPIEARRIAVTAAVWAHSTSSTLDEDFRKLLEYSLQSRYPKDEEGDDDDDHSNIIYNDENDESIWFDCLQRLRWLRRGNSFLSPLLVDIIHKAISDYILENIGGEFEDDNMLPDIQEWNRTVVIPWMEGLLLKNDNEEDEDGWIDWCQNHVLECFIRCRMDDLFDLVAEYPDSHPAVTELSSCLETRPDLYGPFAVSLQRSLQRRLLHPGANTNQIIDVYINTIKVLRHIDSTDRLLQQVTEPVRTYLRGRSDTVRCIITNLTDQEAELYQELRRQDAKPLEDTNTNRVADDNGVGDDEGDDGEQQDDDDDEDVPPDMDWRPPPPIRKQRAEFFDPSIGRKAKKHSSSQEEDSSLDILSILVSIYGSKELFVDEYRTMLADKLLSNLEYNTDSAVHTLELLKLRFGENSMRHCEIMIKDMDDSKRIGTNIQSTLLEKKKKEKQTIVANNNHVDENTDNDDVYVDAAIISHIFWPSLSGGSSEIPTKHHPRIQKELDAFSMEYGQLKNPRRLVWYNQLGTVELELDVWDEEDTNTDQPTTKSITCTPFQATLISYFEDQSKWTLTQLADKIGVASNIIRKKIQFWVNQKVLTVNFSTKTLSSSSTTKDAYAKVATTPGKNKDQDYIDYSYELASSKNWTDPASFSNDDNNGDAKMMMMMNAFASSFDDDDDDDDFRTNRNTTKNAEHVQLLSSYIVGMLKRYKELPLHRIHDMLKLFCNNNGDESGSFYYNKTQRQLSVLLTKLCRGEHPTIECGPDGMYKLVEK